jgi:hypothetical protein
MDNDIINTPITLDILPNEILYIIINECEEYSFVSQFVCKDWKAVYQNIILSEWNQKYRKKNKYQNKLTEFDNIPYNFWSWGVTIRRPSMLSIRRSIQRGNKKMWNEITTWKYFKDVCKANVDDITFLALRYGTIFVLERLVQDILNLFVMINSEKIYRQAMIYLRSNIEKDDEGLNWKSPKNYLLVDMHIHGYLHLNDLDCKEFNYSIDEHSQFCNVEEMLNCLYKHKFPIQSRHLAMMAIIRDNKHVLEWIYNKKILCDKNYLHFPRRAEEYDDMFRRFDIPFILYKAVIYDSLQIIKWVHSKIPLTKATLGPYCPLHKTLLWMNENLE